MQISLARLAPQAEEYLESGNVLAIALAALMGRSLRGLARIRLYSRCLQHLLAAEQDGQVSPAVANLLGDVVKTYLPIEAKDRAALQQHLDQEGAELMALDSTELTWASRYELEVTKTVMINTRRADIKEILAERFGGVSPDVSTLIDATTGEDELNALFKRALRVQTQDELALPPAS